LAETCDATGEDLEYLADQIKNSGKVAQTTAKAYVEMAKDQARFDKAVESSIKNYDDWLEELQAGQETGVVAAETIGEIREAYGDLLDLDGSDLSSSFLKSTENLQLMREALEGNEEAY
jgi:polyhydroxyalkanoate synthesis regulator phasin